MTTKDWSNTVNREKFREAMAEPITTRDYVRTVLAILAILGGIALYVYAWPLLEVVVLALACWMLRTGKQGMRRQKLEKRAAHVAELERDIAVLSEEIERLR